MWLLSPLLASDVGVYGRYRVDVPDYPGAVTTSATGSVLETEPEGIAWTIEEAPSLDVDDRGGSDPGGSDPGGYDAVEAIAAMNVEPWHTAGIDGTGARIAVFDAQFYLHALWADELGAVQTADCQAHRSCDVPIDAFHTTYTWEEGAHGIACAQAIHDVAPGAELYLVRVGGSTSFENAAEWAARNDIDVVSMSMSFFSNSFYDGSGLTSTIAEQMRADGVLLVNSAGNYAEEHWDGDFEDADGDGDMDFPWGSSYLPVYYGEGEQSVVLSWNQFGNCGDTDFDLYLYDADGSVVGRSEANQPNGESCSPVERATLHAVATDWYYARVVRRSGDPLTRIRLFARNGYAWAQTPGSLADPGSSRSSFTVGAVRAQGYLQNGPEDFSSVGPTWTGVSKPNISGPDGLTTAVYGSTGFYGTSASTPAVAAAIALVMQHEDVDAFTAAQKLVDNAVGEGTGWSAWDGELGAGRARLWPMTERGCTNVPVAPSWEIAGALLWWGVLWRRR